MATSSFDKKFRIEDPVALNQFLKDLGYVDRASMYLEYKLTFDMQLKPTEPYDLPTGTMIYDGYTCTGMRVHVVKEDMDAPIIWNNALIISEGMLA